MARRERSDEATPEQLLREHLRQLGSRGGKARLEKLTPEQRSEVARKAAKARWKSKKKSASQKGAGPKGD